jgi:IS605 OrfB family transposase
VKAARLLAREHHRIADIRRSFLHEVSTQLAKTHSGLAIEDLPVANLLRNKRLARAITDAAWTEFSRQLRYKTAWLGASSWSAIAGSPPPRSALLAVGPHNRWRWGRGPFVAVSVGWSWTETATPPPISPLGLKRQLARSSRPRTAKQAAGSSMPQERRALAIALALVKPASMSGEPTLQHLLGPWTPEKGGVRPPRRGRSTRCSDSASGSPSVRRPGNVRL